MPYKIELRLRDTEIDCGDDKIKMDKLFDSILIGLQKAGVPDKNIILLKEWHEICNLGQLHNGTIYQFGE